MIVLVLWPHLTVLRAYYGSYWGITLGGLWEAIWFVKY